MSTDTPITDRMVVAPDPDGDPVVWLPTIDRYGSRTLAYVAGRWEIRHAVPIGLTNDERERVTEALWQRLTAGLLVAPKCAHIECPEYAIEHPTHCADHEHEAPEVHIVTLLGASCTVCERPFEVGEQVVYDGENPRHLTETAGGPS